MTPLIYWKLLSISVAWCVSAFLGIGPAWAWGATGHEWVSGIAVEKLPDSVPAFIRTPEAATEIAVMGRELDRSKGAGKTHDAERDPGHYVDLADDGSVVGILPLDKLPVTREEYDTLLRAGGETQYKAGYLPYSIVDGFQQLRKDFAYWRALTKALLASLAQVEPLYALEKEGGVKKGDPRSVGFATTRLAAGAQAVRDMIVQTWEESANTPIGYPMVHVAESSSILTHRV